MDARWVRERVGEWHLGVWYNREVLSFRLVKWAFIIDWRWPSRRT